MHNTIDELFTTELTPEYQRGYDQGRNDGVDGVLNEAGSSEEYVRGYMDGWVDAQPCE